ncbi:iron-containing alcohol dehydrogenase [Pontivivens insulae]|uniref:Alcohol dehydrogenase 2 n=1 Tax=Pontivivens insulae TaxID=1639689 RepID=A0A2R8ADH9_9RHOB|nr:iron-containing alcohol dehydrogenase [Pontivivens insulae]RED14051.1 alcohol dehydrogenase [Pontivivens insulae]SPF30125.1 Long-chain-alcohol dehydrogenase 1 [Pontivivens insulae]
MTGFEFRTTPQLVIGANKAVEAIEMMKARGVRRVGLVSDATLRQLGLTEPLEQAARAAGLGPDIFDAILPDPTEEMLDGAIAALSACDGIIAIGGGSPLDIAKLVAVRLRSDQPLDQMWGVGNVTGPRAPLVLIPTTAGTGSEVTPISILTTRTNEKMGVVSPVLLPDAAILDATLTLGLPPAVTAATGVDAMVHAIEAYTSKRLKNPLSDMLARQALTLLGGNIRQVCDVPGDVSAREAMLLGSCLAGQAFANAPVAAVHALAYPLGGQFHVPHGLSNCLVLPEVLAFNAPAASALYAELAPLIFAEGVPLADGFRTLAPEIGLVTTLREVGVTEGDLEALAADAMKQTRLLINNPREVTYDDALAIYRAVF